MAAFAMLSLTSPALLACDTERVEGHVPPIYGLEHAPCDTSRRERIEPVFPASLRPVFQDVLRQLQRGKAREPMLCLHGASVLALDGTGSCSSKTMHCPSWLHKVHRHGAMTSQPHMLGAAMIHPDFRAVMPLMPAPMVPQDGPAKKAGERHAAKRCLVTRRQDHPHLTCIVTEERRSATAPPIATRHEHGYPSLLGGKEGDQASLFTQVQAAEGAGRMTASERHDRAAGVAQRLRFMHDGPLKASRADVRVHGMAYGESSKDTLQPFSWVTHVRVSPRNVSTLLRGGRARWKMAHATFKTLKNPGDNFAHTSGHGEQNLSVVFAALMMRAFLVDHTPQLCGALCRAVWLTLGSTRRVWERLRALCYGYRLASMRELLEALFDGYERHRPLLSTDTS